MIEVRNLSKRFDSLVVLEQVSFQVREGSLVVVLGPSGTGKTVLLKSMIGLLPVDDGEVLFDGRRINFARDFENYELRKNLGFVFQGTALFDSLNVAENIALPIIEHTTLDQDRVQKRVDDVLRIVGMSGKENLYPQSLSGGMKRLVAIGRAIALNPKYIFYDEPTTGLDPIMRDRVVELINHLKKKFRKSCMVVTHDLPTAKRVGDEIYMLKNGRITILENLEKAKYE